MLNLILSLIVAYYLIKTGDLFRILRKATKFVSEFLISLKQEANQVKSTQDKTSRQPVDILKVRFAKGEISQQEYESMKSSL